MRVSLEVAEEADLACKFHMMLHPLWDSIVVAAKARTGGCSDISLGVTNHSNDTV